MEAHPRYANKMHKTLLEIETKTCGFSDQGTLVNYGYSSQSGNAGLV